MRKFQMYYRTPDEQDLTINVQADMFQVLDNVIVFSAYDHDLCNYLPVEARGFSRLFFIKEVE